MAEKMTFSEIVAKITPAKLYENIEIDTVTQELIFEWYEYRRVTDNEKFEKYFRRQLKLILEQYKNYLRIATIDFDPMTTNYVERYVLRNSNTMEDITGDKTQTGKNQSNWNGNTTTNNSGSNVNNITGNNTLGQNTSSTSNNNKTSQALNGTLPQSNMYSNGFPDTLRWNFASAQGETLDRDNNTSNGQTSSNETFKSLNDTVYKGKENTINQTTLDGTNNLKENTNKLIIGNRGDEEKEILTGRNGMPAPDLLEKAKLYILKTNAFSWLIDNLDICFMGVLEWL